MNQHRVSREQRREHDDVAEQEDPEAVSDDNALGRWAAVLRSGPQPAAAGDDCRDAHRATSARCALSNCASFSAGISASSWSRQAKTNIVMKAPIAPSVA